MLPARYHEMQSNTRRASLGDVFDMRASLGAPPTSVEYSLPGAHEDVSAYADRIEQAWSDFWDRDVRPWSKNEWITPSGTVIGDVLPTGTPDQQAKQKADLALFQKMVSDRQTFEKYKDEKTWYSFLGPTTSAAWQRFQLFEQDLNNDRDALALTTGKPLVSPKPGQLEAPGGLAASDPTGWILSLVKWVVVGIGLFYGGKFLVGVYQDRSGSAPAVLPAHAEPEPEHHLSETHHEAAAEG